MSGVRTALITWATAWREARSNPASFWSAVGIMAANDAVIIVFWILFFERVGTINGWDLDRLVVLFAIIATAAGIVLGLFNNLRRIGELATNGELDAVLSLPTSPLVHLLCRRIAPINIGDIVFGVVLFAVLGQPNPSRIALFAFGVTSATLIIAGFLLLLGSASFWLSRNEGGELGFHALVIFSTYPVDIFSGPTRIFLYTAVPAGFVSTAPARLVEEFDTAWAAAIAAVAVATALAGWAAFTVGLRRYTSGAVWTQA